MKTIVKSLLLGTVILGLFHRESQAQQLKKQWIVPGALIVGGSGLLLTQLDRKVQESIPKTHTIIDDYTQFAQLAILIGADLAGVATQHNALGQGLYFGTASFCNALVVQSIKRITDRSRPNGSPHAFPSGHTSQAFVTARVLWHELKDSQPLLAYSGYVFAGATGILRMTNNKHWITDVLVGAGVGMLITDLVYYFRPFRQWNIFPNLEGQSQLQFSPLENGGLLSYRYSF